MVKMDVDLDGPWDTTNAQKISYIADGQNGIILKGYNAPNEIYAFLPLTNKKEILVIIMLEEKEGSFETKFMDIIKSVKFTN